MPYQQIRQHSNHEKFFSRFEDPASTLSYSRRTPRLIQEKVVDKP
jgi:hypothetical protein